MAFCQKCGAQNPDGTRFCSSCGAELPVAAQPQYAQQPFAQQPFAQQAAPGFGVPAGLSKKEFLDLPTNSKIKSSIKTAVILASVVAFITVIINFVQLQQIKAKIDSNPFLYMKDGFMTTFYSFIVLTVVAAVCTIAAYITLNIVISVIGAVAYAVSLIIALSSGGSAGWLCFMLMVILIFVPYNLFVLNKQYEEYKAQNGMSGMNF